MGLRRETRGRCELCRAPSLARLCPLCSEGARQQGGPLPPCEGGSRGLLVDGAYRLAEEIGRGGSGAVFRAIDEPLDREVAIKFLLPEHHADLSHISLFRREAQTLSRLSHSNVLAIYATGRLGAAHYIVTELVRGVTLDDELDGARRRGELLTLDSALRLIRSICDGLEATHRAGVVHRDVKPSNVMLEEATGRVVLVDFGLGRRTPFGAVDLTAAPGGTPAYMAPDNLHGGPKTADEARRADIYSLGVLAYELVTGELPFQSKSWASLLFDHMVAAPPPPSSFRRGVPDELEGVLLWPLAKRPEDRPASIAELSGALAPFGGATPPGSSSRVRYVRERDPQAATKRRSTSQPRFVLVTPDPSLLEIVLSLARRISPTASVHTSSSYSEALEIARRWPTNAILAPAAHYGCPRPVVGRGVAKHVLEARRRDTKLILTVDGATPSERSALEGFGVFRVLDRPVRRGDVAAALDEASRAVVA